jgi:hypothetical protein
MQPSAAASPAAAASSPSGERKYKGVRLRKWGRWVSEIRLPHSRERIWLGSYDTPEKAARAFDAAYLCLRGPGGVGGLNFPGSPPDVRRTSDPDEVYAAAVSHADPAAGALRDADAAEPPPSEMIARDNDGAPAAPAPAPALSPLQLSVPSTDWWELLANLPPLFSPTFVGSHACLLPVSPAAADVTMAENDSCSPCPGLWSFDSSGGSSPITDQSR